MGFLGVRVVGSGPEGGEPGFVDRNITPQHVSVDSTWRSPPHLPCRLQGSGAQGTLPTPAPLGLGLSLSIGVH